MISAWEFTTFRQYEYFSIYICARACGPVRCRLGEINSMYDTYTDLCFLQLRVSMRCMLGEMNFTYGYTFKSLFLLLQIRVCLLLLLLLLLL